MKPSQVVRCLRRLRALYPDKLLSSETMASYAAMLADLSVDQLAAAIEKHAATSRYWPSVAELRALAVEDEAAPPAEIAWGEVMRAVSSVGRYRSPQWSHPAIEAAVEAVGGWQRVCDDDTEGVLRAHFYRTYNAYRERIERDANYSGLPYKREARRLSSGDAVVRLLDFVAGDGQ